MLGKLASLKIKIAHGARLFGAMSDFFVAWTSPSMSRQMLKQKVKTNRGANRKRAWNIRVLSKLNFTKHGRGRPCHVCGFAAHQQDADATARLGRIISPV
jgi:hypothetical protein